MTLTQLVPANPGWRKVTEACDEAKAEVSQCETQHKYYERDHFEVLQHNSGEALAKQLRKLVTFPSQSKSPETLQCLLYLIIDYNSLNTLNSFQLECMLTLFVSRNQKIRFKHVRLFQIKLIFPVLPETNCMEYFDK